MLGLIAYLSSIFAFSPAINLLMLPVVVVLILLGYRRTITLHPGQVIGIFLCLMATALAGLAFLLAGPTVENFEKSIVGAVPYLFLVAAAMIVALFFNEKDLQVVFALILLETLVGLSEFIVGTHSFFVPYQAETEYGSTDLLYYNRVFGLSDNSSVFAFKVLVAWLFLMTRIGKVSRRVWGILAGLLALGLLVSFNRSAILAAILATAIAFRRDLKLLALFGAMAGGVVLVYGESIARQLTRGIAGGDYSHRAVVFSEFTNFIANNPLLGNAGAKAWFYFNGRLYHAHNSFLELVASNGVAVGTAFMLGYLIVVWRAWSIVVPVLVFSSIQYGILWGLVFNDIVLMALFLQYSTLDAHRPAPKSKIEPQKKTCSLGMS